MEPTVHSHRQGLNFNWSCSRSKGRWSCLCRTHREKCSKSINQLSILQQWISVTLNSIRPPPTWCTHVGIEHLNLEADEMVWLSTTLTLHFLRVWHRWVKPSQRYDTKLGPHCLCKTLPPKFVCVLLLTGLNSGKVQTSSWKVQTWYNQVL